MNLKEVPYMKELNEKMDFEEAYEQLREVVAKLEDPKNKIEENIDLYENACLLVAHCHKKLEEAKLQITDINERIAQMKKSDASIIED